MYQCNYIEAGMKTGNNKAAYHTVKLLKNPIKPDLQWLKTKAANSLPKKHLLLEDELSTTKNNTTASSHMTPT